MEPQVIPPRCPTDHDGCTSSQCVCSCHDRPNALESKLAGPQAVEAILAALDYLDHPGRGEGVARIRRAEEIDRMTRELTELRKRGDEVERGRRACDRGWGRGYPPGGLSRSL